MTTKVYLAVYPHPDVSQHDRIMPLELGSMAFGSTVLQQLNDAYPNQRDDLKDAIFWKASCPTVAQLLP